MSDELKEFVRTEGEGWLHPVDVDAFRWTSAPRYPTSRFTERSLHGRSRPETKADWKRWLENEVKLADDPGYYRQLERAWLTKPGDFGEIIVAELPDGTLDVGDGWHRLAMSIARGRRTVPAVVGLPIRSSVKSPAQLDREIDEFLTEEALHRRGLL
jgi:hypothetical protein